MKIEKFIGISKDKKQVTIVKITEPIPGHPGLFKIPEFKLSDGEPLTPLNKELTMFEAIHTKRIIAIIS